MCTSEALRAPPLRLPALRALVPLILMMRPHFCFFRKGMAARVHAQCAHELRVEVVQQIFVVHRLYRADGGCGATLVRSRC